MPPAQDDSKKPMKSTRAAEKIMDKLWAAIKKTELDFEKCSLSRQALATLRKKPNLRTDLDIESIIGELLTQIWSDKLPEAVRFNKYAFKDVVRVMCAVKYSTPEVPIEDEGYPMDNLYVVLSGSVWSEEPEEEGEEGGAMKIRKYMPGDVVGVGFCEMDEDAVWTTSLNVSLGGAELLVMSKYAYEKAMHPHIQVTTKDRALLLRSVYIFEHFDMEYLMTLAGIMQFKTYPSNTTIIRQGDIPQDIFIIIRGHCRVLKDLLMPAEDVLVLRKPVSPTIFSNQSSSPNPSDAKRRPVSSMSAPAGDFRFEVFRQAAPPRSRVPPLRTPVHPDHLVVRTSPSQESPRLSPRSPARKGSQHTHKQLYIAPSPRNRPSPRQRPSTSPQSPSRDSFRTPRRSLRSPRAGAERGPHDSPSKWVSPSGGGTPLSASRTREKLNLSSASERSARTTPRIMSRSRLSLGDSPQKKEMPAPMSRHDSCRSDIEDSWGSRDEVEWRQRGGKDSIKPFARPMTAPQPPSRTPQTPQQDASLPLSSPKGSDSKQAQKESSASKGLVYEMNHADDRGNLRVIVELRELWRGEVFGELGTINKAVRSASVVSMSQVDCLVLPKIDCFRLGFDGGEVAERMAKLAESMHYVYDNDDIRKMIVREFKWKNFKQDLSSDTVFGSNFIKPNMIPILD